MQSHLDNQVQLCYPPKIPPTAAVPLLMKRVFSLAALNAVYFGTAAACAAWCVNVYGLSTATSYVATATACIYGFLTAASLLTLRPKKSANTVTELKPWVKLLLRATFLAVPLAYFSYVASFYLVQNTYCAPGGVARFDAFAALENKLFQKAICDPNIPADVDKRLREYLANSFTSWAFRQWHAADANYNYKVVCQFNLLKDGTIEQLSICKSSGSKRLDEAALAAFDSIASPLPAGSPDFSRIEYTLSFHTQKDIWPVYDNNAITPAQDQFLFNQGKWANNYSDYPRSKKLLLQCLEERRLRFKRGAPELTAVLTELAKLHCRMGLLTESHTYFNDAVDNALVGEHGNPEALVQTFREYADQSFACSKFDKALKLYQQCFSLDPGAFDRTAQIRLAETYFATRNYDSAVKIFSKVVSSDEHAPPKDEFYSLDDERVSLCSQYIKAGHPEFATRLINSCLSRSDKAKSSESKYERLKLLCAFLPVYKELPDKTVGRRYIQSAFAELSSTLDPLSSSVTIFRESIADSLWESGDKAAALNMFQQLVAKYPGEVANRAYALFDQANFFNQKKMATEAERAIREALAIRLRLYDRNDRRVVNLKLALANILDARMQSKEASEIRDNIQVPPHEDTDIAGQVARNYQNAGQYDKAIAIYDVRIRESFKADPEDRHGERSFLLEQVILLCERLHDDKRLEHYLSENYRSEKKRVGFASRAELIRLHLRQNKLAIAESLANQDVSDSLPKDKSQFAAELLADSFLVLAQVKHAQQRPDAAKYYVRRAIEALEPYGRSGVHIVAVGQLAQILAKEGNFASAERLISELYYKELVDADSAVYGDIVEGFNTNGCYFSAGSSDGSKEADEQRSDPVFGVMSNGDYFCDYERLPEQAPMIALNWTALFITTHDYAFLKASTLEALARMQALQSKFKDADRSRSLMFASIESSLDQPGFSKDLLGTELLLKELPKSERQQQVLHHVQKLRNDRTR